MTIKRRKSHPQPLPSDGEVDILAVIWRLEQATVREVHDAMGKDCNYNTTLKQMQLMVDKGLLVRKERFGSHVYESGMAKDQISAEGYWRPGRIGGHDHVEERPH